MLVLVKVIEGKYVVNGYYYVRFINGSTVFDR